MNIDKTAGLSSIIIGLMLIIFPMFSSELISIIIGLSLLFFGISTVVIGFNMRDDIGVLSNIIMVIGIISVIFGILFIFFIDALAFLVSIQFYVVGFIMIVSGISGLMVRSDKMFIISSIIVLVMGFVSLALAIFAINQPIYVSIIIGLSLILEGVTFLVDY